MKFISITFLLLAFNSYAKSTAIDVIYGEDNRTEVYQSTNELHRSLAASTAGMVDKYMLGREGDNFFLKEKISLADGLNICPTERFAEQPLLANCSGFLVGDDILVTAGHCFKGAAGNSCKTHVWVFGLELTAPGTINTTAIPKENIYKCQTVIKAKLNENEDFSVIKLDRKVVGRSALKFRTQGQINSNAELVVIGHPSMLPTKIAPGGRILYNKDKFQFTTTLDTFQGNSGSAVFDARTGLLEGILVSGKTDYYPSVKGDEESCSIVNYCDMNGQNCSANDAGSFQVPGENVTRITTLSKYF